MESPTSASSFEIHGPARLIRDHDGRLEKTRAAPWIKLTVEFRKSMLRQLKGSQLSIFLCLALHINEDNKSWPSLDMISEETGYSVRAVQDNLKKLHERGWVNITSGLEHGSVNTYQLCEAVAIGRKAPYMGVGINCQPNSRGNGRDSMSEDSNWVGKSTRGGLANRRREFANEVEPGSRTKEEDSDGKPSRTQPEAIKVFRENAHRFPAKSWWEKIDAVVGEDPEDLETWGRVVFAWVGMGWNPVNVKGMLDCYHKGEIPGAAKEDVNAGYEVVDA